MVISPAVLSLFSVVFSCSESYVFPYEAKNGSFKFFLRFFFLIFVGIALYLGIASGEDGHFHCINPIDHDYGRAFHILICFSISFFSVFRFLLYKIFTCLVRILPQESLNFFFGAVSIVCLIPLFVYLSIVYRRATDFCINFCVHLLCWRC